MNFVHSTRKRKVRDLGGSFGSPVWKNIIHLNYYNPHSGKYRVEDTEAPRGKRATWRFMSYALDVLETRSFKKARLFILRNTGHAIAISTLHDWKKWDGI